MPYPSVIYFIRHGEKYSPTDLALDAKGKQRARKLVEWARDRKISAIYTLIPDLAAIRPEQTALPCGFFLDIPIYALWTTADPQGVKDALGSYEVSANKPALVIWEHVCLASLITLFDPSYNKTWPNDNYCSVVKITNPMTPQQRLSIGCEDFFPGDAEKCRIFASGAYKPNPDLCTDTVYPR